MGKYEEFKGKYEEIRDKFGDVIGTSKFAQDRALVKQFTGGEITREDYETYSKNGTVEDIFGHIVHANPQQRYYGFTVSYGYEQAKAVRNFMLASDVLSFMMEANVSLDLDDPKNARTKEIYLEGIQSYAMKNNKAPRVQEPYCNHPEIAAAIEGVNRRDYTDGPVYNPKTATKDQLDEMSDNGIGF